MICDRCKHEIHPSDGMSYMGMSVTHRVPDTCVYILRQEIARLEAANAAPHEDKERLDWVETHREEINNIESGAAFPDDQWTIWRDANSNDGERMGRGLTLRESIDAARKS